MAAAIKELRQAVLPTMVALVRHYTMVAIAQQAGPFPMNTKQNKLNGMDPLVLIDAMAVIMGHEEKGKTISYVCIAAQNRLYYIQYKLTIEFQRLFFVNHIFSRK